MAIDLNLEVTNACEQLFKKIKNKKKGGGLLRQSPSFVLIQGGESGDLEQRNHSTLLDSGLLGLELMTPELDTTHSLHTFKSHY